MFENVRHGAKSDIGLQRPTNEDSLLIVDQSHNGYDLKRLGIAFVIADGIGGHAAGEIASRMACAEVVSSYYRDEGLFPDGADNGAGKVRKLEQAIRSAHHKIIQRGTENGDWRGMGTTLSALVLTEDQALIAHVGDSRIYRRRNSEAQRLTIDHTTSQDLIDRGLIPPDEGHSLCGHILTQTLGGYDELGSVFTKVEDWQAGDAFLLCTDGLHDLVNDSEIREILVRNYHPQTACDALVQAALGKGGADNITVIVIQV